MRATARAAGGAAAPARAAGRAPARAAGAADRPVPIVPCSFSTTAMGGRLTIHLDGIDDAAAARTEARRAAARIARWAARLSRHIDDSELSRLNADPRRSVPVGPTLGAALEASVDAGRETGGLVDIGLLDELLAAEAGRMPAARRGGECIVRRATDHSTCHSMRRSTVTREPGLCFDLGGVGKGWIADRALRLLDAWPSAIVDADGDLAVRAAPGRVWEIGVDDPRDGGLLAVLRIGGTDATRCGVATSGTSVHRWNVGGEARHHLIDPRTGRPAITDVVQATVVAGTALRAEVLAKAVVIAGAAAGFALLERARIRAALVLTDAGETLALPETLGLLAA